MAERPQGFARRMMAQRLMSDARDDPFSDSRFFSGRIRPSMQDMAEPTRFSDMAMPAYATGATASLFAPGAGVTDIMGFAPDPAQPGELLPSFGQNITQGNYLDAGLQALGGAGDVMMAGGAFVPPLALIGTTLKAPRAARVAGQAGEVAADAAKPFGGLAVREDVPNFSSISASLNDYEIVPNIQDIPMTDIPYPQKENLFYSSDDFRRVEELASQIKESQEINPLIVVQDKEGYYVLEGAHRLAALNELGVSSFPAVVVRDLEEVPSLADVAKVDPNQQMGDALAQAQARYFETGSFEPPTAENPVSVVLPTETEPGIIAFHGSGADFDEFRLEMIGTGEGAQAYGYGLYFTDSEDIAKFYRDSIGRGRSSIVYDGSAVKNAREVDGLTDREMILDSIAGEMAFFDQKPANVIERKIRSLKAQIENPDSATLRLAESDAEAQELADLIRQSAQRDLEIYESLDPDKFTRGKMYKVALSPKPDELLDYDLPLNQQPRVVQKQMENLVGDLLAGEPEIYDRFDFKALAAIRGESPTEGYSPTGDDILTDLERFFAATSQEYGRIRADGAVKASQLLNDFGIPGIKYRAAGSRGAGTSDEAAERNYVIFDDKAVKILEKYGIVGPVLVTGGAVAATQRGGNEEGSIFPDA
jgi:hypothetical protein